MKKSSCLILFGLLAFGGLQVSVRAQPSPGIAKEDTVDLRVLDCKTLLKAEDDNREVMLIFMHGYMSGKKGEMIVQGPALSAISDQVVDTCISNPSQTLMSVFEQYRE